MLKENIYSFYFEATKRAEDIPFISFPKHWEVKLIPPYGLAAIRFLVRLKDKPSQVMSVYFDTHDKLGCMGKPYWEIHPDINGDCSRFTIDETDKLISTIEDVLSLDWNQI